MLDTPSPFRLDSSPAFGAPVFTLGYRAYPQRLPWWRRWWHAILSWFR